VSRRQADAGAWAIGLVTLGLPIALLVPTLGWVLIAAGVVVLGVDRYALA
jgi:hypothetical protein